LFTPNDARTGQHTRRRANEPLEPFHPTFQLVLIIFFYFVGFAMTQLVRIATPIALKEIHDENVKTISGIAFTLARFASAVSALASGPMIFREGRRRVSMVGACLVCGAAYLLLSQAKTVPSYVLFFVLISLIQAAMVPATNSLIAANVPR